MGLLKFITKTIIVTAVCTFTFNIVLDKVIDSEAKEKCSIILDKVVDSEAKEKLVGASNEISRLLSLENLTTIYSKYKSEDNEDKSIDNIQDDDNRISSSANIENQNINTEDVSNEDVEKVIEVKEDIEGKEDFDIYIPKNIIGNKNDNFIFIGDSRTVAYKEIVNLDNYDFVTFIAEVGKGFDWFNKIALEKLNTRFNTTDLKYNVVLNLGINDLQNIDKYIKYYNKLVLDNPNHNFFVVSVNKVDTEKMIKNGYNKLENRQIEEFNNELKKSLSDKIHFIDTYSYFENKNLDTTDGLHYTNETSTEILNYISDYIKAIE